MFETLALAKSLTILIRKKSLDQLCSVDTSIVSKMSSFFAIFFILNIQEMVGASHEWEFKAEMIFLLPVFAAVGVLSLVLGWWLSVVMSSDKTGCRDCEIDIKATVLATGVIDGQKLPLLTSY